MVEHKSNAPQHAKPPAGHGPAHEHGTHPPPGLGKYLAVFGALLVLTLISFGIASSPIMDTPAIGWTGMMTVSVCKALLVVLFFMHLRWEANWKYVLTIPASIMSLFLLLMLVPDVGMRTRWYSEERWYHAAEPQVAPVHDDHNDEAQPEEHGAHK